MTGDTKCPVLTGADANYDTRRRGRQIVAAKVFHLIVIIVENSDIIFLSVLFVIFRISGTQVGGGSV